MAFGRAFAAGHSRLVAIAASKLPTGCRSISDRWKGWKTPRKALKVEAK